MSACVDFQNVHIAQSETQIQCVLFENHHTQYTVQHMYIDSFCRMRVSVLWIVFTAGFWDFPHATGTLINHFFEPFWVVSRQPPHHTNTWSFPPSMLANTRVLQYYQSFFRTYLRFSSLRGIVVIRPVKELYRSKNHIPQYRCWYPCCCGKNHHNDLFA